MNRYLLIILLLLSVNLAHPVAEVGKVKFRPPDEPFGIDYQPGIDFTHTDTDSRRSASGIIPSSSAEVKATATAGQVTTVALDGGLSSHTGMAVNGTVIELPGMPNVDLNLIPVELLQGVDIYKDNLSAYGITATGGLVDFLLPGTDAEGWMLSLGGGSFGLLNGAGYFSPDNSALSNLDFLIGGAYSRADNGYALPNGGTAANLDYNRYSAIAAISTGAWAGNFIFTHKHAGTGTFYAGNGRQTDDLLLTDWARSGDVFLWNASYILWNNQFHNDTVATDSTQQNHTLKVSGKTSLQTGIFTLNLTLASTTGVVDGNAYGTESDERIDLTLDSVIDLGTVQIGAAVNQLYSFDRGYLINPALSATVALNTQWYLIGRISRAYRQPSFNDLFWQADGYSAGNPDLHNEDGIRAKVGLLYLALPLYGSVSVGYSRITDLILWIPDDNGIWTPRNQGIVSGYLLNAAIHYKRFWGKTVLSASVGFSYNRSVNTDPDSLFYKKRTIYVPLYKTAAEVSIGREDVWDVRIGFRQVSERYTTELNTKWLEPYYLLDVSASYRFFYAAVYNLLNQRYEEIQGYPLKGISFEAGVQIEL